MLQISQEEEKTAKLTEENKKLISILNGILVIFL